MLGKAHWILFWPPDICNIKVVSKVHNVNFLSRSCQSKQSPDVYFSYVTLKTWMIKCGTKWVTSRTLIGWKSRLYSKTINVTLNSAGNDQHIPLMVSRLNEIRVLFHKAVSIWVRVRAWCLASLSTIYFSYIVASVFLCGGNRSTRRKPPTCHKSLINFITICCIEYTSPWAGFDLAALLVIGNVCTGSISSTTIRSRPRRPPSP
jgi:hypothetical protein